MSAWGTNEVSYEKANRLSEDGFVSFKNMVMLMTREMLLFLA